MNVFIFKGLLTLVGASVFILPWLPSKVVLFQTPESKELKATPFAIKSVATSPFRTAESVLARKWTCTASCNVEGTKPYCTGRVNGGPYSSSSEADACREAKRQATQSAPLGCYARHCQCNCRKGSTYDVFISSLVSLASLS